MRADEQGGARKPPANDNDARNLGAKALSFLAFVCLATVGMGAIGLSLLAGPVRDYYAEEATLEEQRARIAALREEISLRDELLANADRPAVVERSAAASLRYVPRESAGGRLAPLVRSWPELAAAVTAVQAPAQAPPHDWRAWAEALAGRSETTLLLGLLGAATLLVGFACFGGGPSRR